MAKQGESEERLDRLEEVLGAIGEAWSRKSGSSNPRNPSPSRSTPGFRNPGPRPDAGAVKLAAAAGLTSSSLVQKFSAFASGLEPDELQQLGVLVAPAITAAQEASKNPMSRTHAAPADFLRELDIKLASDGRVTVSDETEDLATPTITTVTITTTVASHPIIGCSVVEA